jgi:hypothetical protein
VRYRQAPDVVLKAGTDPDIQVRYWHTPIFRWDIDRLQMFIWRLGQTPISRWDIDRP